MPADIVEMTTGDPDQARLAHLIDLIAANALTVFPNTTMTASHLSGPGRVAPAALRRAVAYLDDHAAQPVTLTDVAGAARVTPRALQAAFRQHFGKIGRAHV